MYKMFKRLILLLLSFNIIVLNKVNARYFIINGWNGGGDHRTPADIMVDVTNNIGLQVLECHNANNHNNIAFSPYGLTSVLIALQEGVTGEAGLQIHRTARFPFDRDVIRVGFRDIHRLLRSYFVPKEGFLAGLSLSNENITLSPGYKSILQFYGYDLQPNMTTSTALPPVAMTTTVATTVAESEQPTTVTETNPSSSELPPITLQPETPEIETTIATVTSPITTMQSEMDSMSMETTTEPEKVAPTTEVITTMLIPAVTQTSSEAPKELSTMSAMTSDETSVANSPAEEITPVMTQPPTTQAIETTITPKAEPETTTTQKAEPETTTAEKPEPETTTTQNPEPETPATQKPEPETTTTQKPEPETTTTLKSEPETTIIQESETTTTQKIETEPVTEPMITTTMTPMTESEMTTIMETVSTETMTMPDAKDEEPTMAATMTPEESSEKSEEPEVENNSPETFEFTDTHTDETASASVSGEGSNEIETLSIEEMTTYGKDETTTGSGEYTTNSLESATLETESPRRKRRSLADYLIARHYDGQNYFTFQEPIVTSSPPVQKTHQYPFLVNGIKEQYNINYTEYDTVLPFTYLPLLRSLALKFPLDSDKYYLLIVLPLNPQGVNTLICDIRKYENLRNIVRNLKDTYVRAIIPSFMLKGFVFLTNTLQRLGIHNIFEPGHADFSLMTEDENIYVTNIEQAVTVTIRNYMESTGKKKRYYNYRPVEFKVTHPFIYFIMDSTLDVTLMTGKVVNPLNSRIQ